MNFDGVNKNFLNNVEISSIKENNGQIQLILGPMFSGKTSELLRRLRRYHLANYTCLVVKYKNDTRYDIDYLTTHDRIRISAISTINLFDLAIDINSFNVIGIDEGQFFLDIVDFSEKMTNLGKILIIAALDGSYRRIGFNNFLSLIPLAESIVKLSSICMKCYANAFFTKRKGNETTLEIIGGKDMYLAVCRRCYFKDDE